MVRLTAAEASVVGAVLAGSPGLERDRIRDSGLSPRTYETARRRLFERGVIAERYVPNPVAFAFPWVTIRIGTRRPAEVRMATAGATAGPVTTLRWGFETTVLSVDFAASPLDIGPIRGSSKAVSVDLRERAVPVFFDFAGEWAQVSRSSDAPRYPRGLGVADAQVPPSESPTSPIRRAAERLVRAGNSAGIPGAPGFHLGSLFRDTWGERAVSDGVVERRGFVNPAAAPELGGWRLRELVLITGRPKEPASTESLYRVLVADRHVRPFLFAADREVVILGTLSPSPRREPPEPGRSNRAVLADHLSDIEVRRVPVDQLRLEVDHHYAGLLPSPGA